MSELPEGSAEVVDASVRATLAHYSRYPYPYSLAVQLPRWLPRFVRRWLVSPKGGRIVRYLDRLVPAERRARGRLLDAGCGTGEVVTTIATAQRWRAVTAIDLTPRSLQLAEQFARSFGAEVTFRQANLCDAATLPRDAGPFDVITSLGVLHYLPDPAVGLANLRDLLAPDGVMLLYFYGTPGRRELLRRQQVLSLLCPDARDLDAKLQVANRLGWGGMEKQRGPRALLTRLLGGSPEAAAASRAMDDLAQSEEQTYTARELVLLLRRAELRVTRWLRGHPASAHEVLPPDLAQRVEALPELERLDALDLLCTPGAFVVAAQRAT